MDCKVYAVDVPAYTGSVNPSRVNRSTSVSFVYQITNPAGGFDLMTRAKIVIPAGWAVSAATADSGTATIVGSDIVVTGISIAAGASLNVTVQAVSPDTAGSSTWDSYVSTFAYPYPLQYLIANAPVKVDVNVGENNAQLNKNSINPLKGESVNLDYTVKEDCDVLIAIYNIRGERVKTVFSGRRAAGAYSDAWNGTVDSSAVGSGVYLVYFQIGS